MSILLCPTCNKIYREAEEEWLYCPVCKAKLMSSTEEDIKALEAMDKMKKSKEKIYYKNLDFVISKDTPSEVIRNFRFDVVGHPVYKKGAITIKGIEVTFILKGDQSIRQERFMFNDRMYPELSFEILKKLIKNLLSIKMKKDEESS